jgi:hypothetical protein
MIRKSRASYSTRRSTYDLLEPRNLLAGDISLGNLNSGVAVSDDATGEGRIMYSEVDVHTRFTGVPTTNADHFIATRLNGLQWQYNNDSDWIDFTPVESDLLVASVNFDGDTINRGSLPLEGIDAAGGHPEDDFWFAANRYGGAVDVGEFQVLGTSFGHDEFASSSADLTPSEFKLRQISIATHRVEAITFSFPRTASVAPDGTALLSWRVHLLPFLGYESLYEQFNLDEPWNSANNLALSSQIPEIYSSPHFNSASETSFLAVTGSGTLFPAFGPEISFADIPDGSHTTLMFVEADADQAVVWTKPADLAFDPANPLAGIGSASPDGFAAVMASGEAYTLPGTIDTQNVSNMAIRNDGNFVDFSEFAPYWEAENNLRQISLSAHNYESRNQNFPAHAIYAADGTTPLLSWRVAVLPFIEHQDLYDQFHLDQPWDSPHNLSLLPLMPKVYAHPLVANGMTNFLAVTGPGTVFELADVQYDFRDFDDGASNTAMFVEADPDRAVEWTKPKDWVVDFANPKAGLGGILPNGFNVAFGDGSVFEIDSSIDDANFAKMLTRAGNDVVDFSQIERNNFVSNQLRELTLGIFNFESANQFFPQHGTYSDTGQPLLSWRVQILPYIEQQPLYDLFHHDEPWDSPHNLSLLPLMPEIFKTDDVANGFTVLQGANGPDTMFPLSDVRINFGAVVDGQYSTAMLLQVDDDRAVEWTRPLDLAFDSANPGDGLGGTNASGFYFTTVDGSTHFYNSALDVEDLEFLLQRSDQTPFGYEFVSDAHIFAVNTVNQNKLRFQSISSLNYESATGEFPTHAIYSEESDQGTPLLSWRVAILPFLDETVLYNQFHHDEPWDSPHNLSLIPLMPDFFKHPLVPDGMTNFQAVTSAFNTGEPETMFPLTWRGLSLNDIVDGTSNTALFVEANPDQAVVWTQPDDLVFDPLDPTFGLGDAVYGLGNHFAFADGSVSFLRSCLPDEDIAGLLLRNDGVGSSFYDYECDVAAATVAKSGIVYGNGQVATDKKPLLPGQTATFENYSSYIDGITSITVDLGRPGDLSEVSASDFVFRTGNGNDLSDFTALGLTPTVSIDSGGGDNESARITLEFPAGSIVNTWLQVTVLANDNTGLNTDNMFYFGSAIGETGDNPNNAVVNLIDVGRARVNQSGFETVGVDNPYDINRDGRVNLVDVAMIRTNQSGFAALRLITAPGASNRADTFTSSASFSSASFSSTSFSSASFSSTSRLPGGNDGSRADDFNKDQTKRNAIQQRGFLPAEGTYLSGSIERGAVEQLLEGKFETNNADLFDPSDSIALQTDLNNNNFVFETTKPVRVSI